MPTNPRLLLQHLLHPLPPRQPAHPLPIIRIIPLHLLHLLLVLQQKPGHASPRHEGQVGVGALVADEVVFALEGGVEHGGDAEDFGFVALDCGGEGFVVEVSEPVFGGGGGDLVEPVCVLWRWHWIR